MSLSFEILTGDPLCVVVVTGFLCFGGDKLTDFFSREEVSVLVSFDPSCNSKMNK